MAKAKNSEKAVKPNIFMRLGLFIKQIIDELRKVVTPTSKELFFWALAVFIFVLLLMALVTGMDFGLRTSTPSRLRSLLSRLPKLLPMRQLPRSNRSLTFPQNLTHPSTMQMLSPTERTGRRLNPHPVAFQLRPRSVSLGMRTRKEVRRIRAGRGDRCRSAGR